MNNTTNKKELFHRSMRNIDPNAYKEAQSIVKSQHSHPFGSGSSLSKLYEKAKKGDLTPNDAPGIASSLKGGRVRKSRRKKTKTRRRKKTKSRRPKKTKSRRVKKSKSRRR